MSGFRAHARSEIGRSFARWWGASGAHIVRACVAFAHAVPRAIERFWDWADYDPIADTWQLDDREEHA